MNTTLTPADLDPRRQAMLLYFQGYRVARIAEMLGEKVATVHSWKKRDKWGDYGPLDQMQLTTAARYCQLIMKEHKEGKDFKEIDLLARQSERHARIGKFNNGGNEADLNPNVANRNKGPRRQPEKNVFTDEQIEKLEEIFHSSMFNYQRHWWEAGKTNRIRNLLKSRQIGATFYFAREALIDALLTGRNQIFLSASKSGPTFMHWPCARLAGAKCGSDMTRRKVRRTATAPDAWWWRRQPCRAVSSAFLSVTSGAEWTSAPRLTPSKN